MVSTQEEIQLQLGPTLNAAGHTDSFTVFLAGLVLGVVMGLFFASYLVKLVRMGGKKAAKNPLPPAKDFSSVVKGPASDSASLRTGSTRSGGSDDANDLETDTFL